MASFELVECCEMLLSPRRLLLIVPFFFCALSRLHAERSYLLSAVRFDMPLAGSSQQRPAVSACALILVPSLQ